ncbi:Peroxidase superfamily protein [Euphorbia peplus]|nr:Peroxidase superfamily protein [Euphorbia peplus]
MDIGIVTLAFALVIFAITSPVAGGLSVNHYDDTCPHLEYAVTAAVKKEMNEDNTVLAGLLTMHFHDCFVRGCDGSILLERRKGNKEKAEKEGPPNISLHAFM